MKIIRILIVLSIFFIISPVHSNDHSFSLWLKSFKKVALKKGISEKTFNIAMSNVKFLPKVIEYDRFQPEFYEDTITYITKRTSKKKIEKPKTFTVNEAGDIIDKTLKWEDGVPAGEDGDPAIPGKGVVAPKEES